MIPKSERYSFKKGIPKQVSHSPLFTLRFENGNVDKLMLGVVVGKKVDKLAVIRNTVKRKFTNIVYNYLKDKNIKGSFVFYLKPDCRFAEDIKIIDSVKKTIDTINKHV